MAAASMWVVRKNKRILTILGFIACFLLGELTQFLKIPHIALLRKTIYLTFHNETSSTTATYLNKEKQRVFAKRIRHSSLDWKLATLNSNNVRFLTNNLTLCKNINLNSVSILAYVHSAVNHSLHRQNIRKTWGSELVRKRLNMALIFIVGKSLSIEENKLVEMENFITHDILRVDFIDSYGNLSYKAIAALKWIRQSGCSNVTYVLKSDDDIFINVVELNKYLYSTVNHKYFNTDRMIFCNQWVNFSPHRNPKSKWHVNTTLFKYDNYPNYCQGAAFVMTSQAAEHLYYAIDGQEFFALDDVLLTGLLAQKAGVSILANSYLYDCLNTYTAAYPITSVKRAFITVRPESMELIWKKLLPLVKEMKPHDVVVEDIRQKQL